MTYYITFYSYKGGVGRTLALVNTAFAMASRGKRVLMWDLDLEAPSLLQFPQFVSRKSKIKGGTLDLITAPESALNQLLQEFVVPAAPNIQLLPAGADDLKYPERYTAVQEYLSKSGEFAASRRMELIRKAIEALPEDTRPQIVLIDSRTGLTDLGAICTVQLPHTVVLIYTMSHQGAFGTRRMLKTIRDASEKLRPQQQVRTVLAASFVPTEEDLKLLQERRDQLKEMGLAPDFEIPFRRALLLREEAYASTDTDPESAEVFGRLADSLLDWAGAEQEPVRLSIDREQDPRHERGRKFEDKVAMALSLMDLEVTQNTMIAGRQIDAIARGKAGLRLIDYIVECKDHEKPRGVDDLDSIHARVLAYQRNENRPWAQGLLVSANGFTAQAKAHAATLGSVILKNYDELLDQLINLGNYNATLINDVAGQPIERLYIEQDVIPDEGKAKPEPVPLTEFVDHWLADPESTFLTLLGDYGTGKTWFTRMFAYRQAQRFRDDSSRTRQPIRIDLRSVAKALDLEGVLYSHFLATVGKNINSKALLHLLEEGRFLLIFDGFDEMATHGDWGVTLENFRQLTRAAVGRAKVLLTCRTHYFRDQDYVQELIAGRVPDLSERGTELYREISGKCGYRLAVLPGFNDSQVRQYVDRSCGERAEPVHQILAREPHLKDLSSRPILLEVIVKSSPRLAQLGSDISVANLYEAYTEDWFNREDWRLRITHENRRGLVEELAAYLWHELDARVHHSALRQVIEPLLNDRAFTVRDLEDADREIRTAAFLTRDLQGNYGFSHRSFLEFFLASWIRRKFAAQDYVTALRHKMLTPPVVRFVEELAGGKLCENAACSVLKTSYIKQASENALLLYARSAGSPILGAQLQGAQLAGFRLSGIDLIGADMTGSDLQDADLSGSQLNDAVLVQANLERANLMRAEANQADFARARLQAANLESAHLESANFSSADLRFANMLNAITTSSVWDDAQRFGIAGPKRPAHPGIAVGSLPGTDPRFIACHPSMPLIAIAAEQGILIIDSQIGALRRCLPHPGTVSAAWDPAGRRLASASIDRNVRVWDAEGGRLLRILEGHSDAVNSVAWCPNGDRLASASTDTTIRVWDSNTGQLLRTLEGHSDAVNSVAWNLAGNHLASASDDKSVRVWNAEKGQSLRTMEGHTRAVNSVAWDYTGGRLASASDDATVRVWEPDTGQLLRTVEGLITAVNSVAWDQSGGRLASACGATVRVWDPGTGLLLRALEHRPFFIQAVAWDSVGRLVSATRDMTVRVWDPEGGQLLSLFRGYTNSARSVAWDPAGRRLASVSFYGGLHVWDAERGNLLQTRQAHSGTLNSVAWCPAGHLLASGSVDGIVRVWHVEEDHLPRTLIGHAGEVNSVAWSPPGRQIASASRDKTVRVWAAESGQLRCTLEGHSDSVRSVAWSPTGHRLASASNDNTVRVWDVETGQLFGTLEGHSDSVCSVAWDPTGRRLASASSDNTVRVWDVESGQLLRILQGHLGSVQSVAWDPSGCRLASASDDQTVRIWVPEQGLLLCTLDGHSHSVVSVAWDPVGRHLASVSFDSTMRVWDVESGRCLWVIHLLPQEGWLALRHDGKFRGNDAGKRHFMFSGSSLEDSWALYPAVAFPEYDLDAEGNPAPPPLDDADTHPKARRRKSTQKRSR